MGSVGAVRNLSPDVIRHVVPLLPPASTDSRFSRARINAGMKHMKVAKDKALETLYPHLRSEILTQEDCVTARDGAPLAVRVYTPKRPTSLPGKWPVVYSLHGGGFISGSIDSEDLINRQLCHAAEVVIISLDYRLAPENKVVPTILNDAEDALKWAFANAVQFGGDVSQGILLSGTSVGGAMAVTLGYRASRSLAVRIRGIISRQAVYIFSEYEGVAKPEWLPYLTSRVENADAPIMNLNTLNQINELCAISKKDVQDPNNFPIFADTKELSSMPPTYLVAAGCCPCVDEVKLYARRLQKAGVVVKYNEYETMPHGFHAFHNLQDAQKEMKETSEGLKWLLSLSE